MGDDDDNDDEKKRGLLFRRSLSFVLSRGYAPALTAHKTSSCNVATKMFTVGNPEDSALKKFIGRFLLTAAFILRFFLQQQLFRDAHGDDATWNLFFLANIEEKYSNYR